MNKNHELTVQFKGLSEEQSLTLEAMFQEYISLSNIGSSADVIFYADGDGSFHPEISITKSPHTRELTEHHLKQFTTNEFDPDYLRLNEE